MHGEIKSMRTALAHQRRGAGRALRAHVIGESRRPRLLRLSLETGSMKAFEPTHRPCESFGVGYCGPFGGYADDPNSAFMTRTL